MKRYRKQAKIAMVVALAATSLGNTIPALSAQEGQVQENNIDKKDETSEVENLPEIEKLPTVEDEGQKETDSEIKEVVEEIATTEDTQIKNEEGNSSVEKTGEEIILNEQYFPDAGFREFIKRECSINDNEVLTEEKRNQVISINVSGTENNPRTDIRSLEGIQYFPNLKQLYCNYQTELTGTLNLSENTKLELIYAWNTKLTGLNINGLTSLTRLDISSNPQLVGEFDLRENSELEWMNAHTTQISNVNVTGLAKLKMFSVANTNVSGELDFTGNTALEELIVRNTKVTKINIQGLTNLINLYIDSNPNLTGEFDLSRNPNLSICHAWGTRITRLNVNGLTNLTSFSVSQNPNLVGDFDLSRNTKLKVVYTWNTSITSLNLNGLTNLTEVAIQDNPNLVGDFDLSENKGLKIVQTFNTQITGLNIDGLTNLTWFDISSNPSLTGEFDLRGNTELEWVNAYNTQISNINVTGLAKLKMFSIANTNVSGEFDFTGNTALEELVLNNTGVTRINTQGLTNLTLVDISSSPEFVGNFDFTSNPALKIINTDNTNIHSINVQGLLNLTHLGVANTPISNLDVSTNTSLQVLDASTNLTWLNIGNNPNLATLIKKDSIIDLGQIGDSFNIATVSEAFRGIDPSKVTIVSGATYDPTTGEVSGYQNGTPIVYSYDSGTMQNGKAVTITVTLNFTKPLMASEIRINSYVGKKYDGTAVSNPTDITKTGSSGVVTFEWFRKTEDGNWESLGEEAPINVGEYGVKALLEADLHYAATDSGEPTPFEITKATSSIRIDSYEGKEWDGTPVSDPTDITRTQNTATVTFKYYRADDTTTEIAAPSEVGAYKVKAFLSGDANYADSESDFVDFNIAALGTTITLTYENQVYTGNPVPDPQKDVHYTVEGSTGDVTIEWYNANDLTTPLTQAPTNVGSYVVKVSVAGTDTHTSASITDSFEITPATSTISIDNYEGKEYDGTAVSNPVDITTTGSDGAITFEWFRKTEDGNWVSLGEQAPVNAGNYGVKAYLAANQNYTAADSGEPTPFEITQVTSTISIDNYEGKKYDGTAVSNPADITTTGSDGAVTFEWFVKTEDGNWVSLGEQAPVNAGNYGVKAYLAANQNYTAADSGEPTPFEITQVTSTISIDNYEGKEYDGTAVSNPADITTTGSDGAVTFEWFVKTEDGNWESLGDQAPVNVGNYGVKAHLAANQNYAAADSGEPIAFTIKKATSTIEILDDLNKTYDKEAVKEPTIKVEGTSETATIAWFKKESDGVTRAITWTPLTSAPVNAGDYKVVVTVAENNNSLGATVEQEFTIAKADTSVTIEGTLDKEYDGVEVEIPNIKVEGSCGATTMEWYKKDTNGMWELIPGAPKEVGEYKVVVKVEEDENYLSVEVEQTFTISEKVEVPSTPEAGEDTTITEEEKVEGVQTGDASQTSMWTMLAGLSMSMLYFFRRKKNK